MRPVSNQLAKLYGRSKTHKFENLKDISPQSHKLLHKQEHLHIQLAKSFPST